MRGGVRVERALARALCVAPWAQDGLYPRDGRLRPGSGLARYVVGGAEAVRITVFWRRRRGGAQRSRQPWLCGRMELRGAPWVPVRGEDPEEMVVTGPS